MTFDGRTYRKQVDYQRLTTALQRVLYRLLDGRWHTLSTLRQIAPSADSRIRDLRKSKFGGFTILAEPRDAAGTWHYKLVGGSKRQLAKVFP